MKKMARGKAKRLFEKIKAGKKKNVNVMKDMSLQISTQKTINPLRLKLRHSQLSKGKKRILKPRKKLHITSNRTINQLSQQKPWRPEGSGMIHLKY